MNKLKLFFLSFLSLLVFGFASCDDKEETPDPVLSNLVEKYLNFEVAGGVKQTHVTLEGAVPEVSVKDNWCSAQVTSSVEGVHTISVTVPENTETTDRSTKVVISYKETSFEVSVYQEGVPLPELTNLVEKNLEFTAEGGEKATHVTLVGEKPTAAVNNDWCSAVVSGPSEGDVYTITVTVQANSTVISRSATLTLYSASSKLEVPISQEADKLSDAKYVPTEVYDLGLGWNLGNQLDAWGNTTDTETYWGNQKATQATLDAVKAAGFTSVRIPVTWMGHIGDAPDYTIDEAWLNRVEEVVGYAEKAGLKAVINIHHDGSADSADKYNGWLQIGRATKDEDLNTQTKDKIKAIWTQVANRFKDKGDFLFFEGLNEIHDGGWGWGDNRNDGGAQYKVFKQWLQVFVDAVRATGGNNATRYLGIPSYDTNFDLAIENFAKNGTITLPEDPANHLMVSVHYYDPYEYVLTNKYKQWGHTADASKAVSGSGETTQINDFKKMKEAFVDKGIPVYVGEFGGVRRENSTDEAFRRYYLEHICRVARNAGIAMMFWDNGSNGKGNEASGLFNHATGEYLNNDAKAVVETMIKGYFADDERYTLETIYKSAPSSK